MIKRSFKSSDQGGVLTEVTLIGSLIILVAMSCVPSLESAYTSLKIRQGIAFNKDSSYPRALLSTRRNANVHLTITEPVSP